MGQRIVLLLAALVITALVTGCSQDSSGSEERMRLPFESIMADLDLTFPDGLTARPAKTAPGLRACSSRNRCILWEACARWLSRETTSC